MSKKIRLALWLDCNRECSGCCNKDIDWEKVPQFMENQWWTSEEIFLTGGEPMLKPQLLELLVQSLRRHPRWEGGKLYMYTAKVDDLRNLKIIYHWLNGITVTLHTPQDVESFVKLNDSMLDPQKCWFPEEHSLRLNIFKDAGELPPGDYHHWKIKDNIEWIKNAPLPEGETLMRLW